MPVRQTPCALLIGVETYDNLGEDKQLRAGRNDVLAFWKVCRRLGFAPQDIRFLTSPKLEIQDIVWAEQELGGEISAYKGKSPTFIENTVKTWFAENKMVLAEATHENILGALQWLATRRAPKDLLPAPRILTYSGHGAKHDGSLVLCPQNACDENKNLVRPISLAKLNAQLGDVDDNLTVVLDCCFAENAGWRGTPRVTHHIATMTNDASKGDVNIVASDIGARVFCASGANESSYQAMIGGYWYSAFSWALTVALEQWQIVGEKGKHHSTISHAELLFRARALLEALSFPQHPVLIDEMANRPVFVHLLDEKAETSPEPNVEWKGGQLDPSTAVGHYAVYKMYAGATLLAQIVATNENSYWGLEPNTEYWKIEGDSFDSSIHTDGIKVTREALDINRNPPPVDGQNCSFKNAVNAAWQNVPGEFTFQEWNGVGFTIHVQKVGTQWTGSVSFVQGRDNKTLLFGDVTTTGVTCQSRIAGGTFSVSKMSLPVLSGGAYYLKSADRGYLRDPKKGSYNWYPNTDTNGKMALHTLRKTDGSSGELCHEDIVYIEFNGERFSTARDSYVWYNSSGNGADEKWKLKRKDSANGAKDVIRCGDTLFFENIGESGTYLYARDDSWVDNRPALQEWTAT